METNVIDKSKCGLQDALVTYLYGEATPAEREQFETHLLECTPCTDEFAELSNARFSVFEWQREEFAPLVTPRIEIPYPAVESAGVFAGLRSLFGLGWPAFAMAAAIAVTLFGLGIWLIQPKGVVDDQVAKTEPAKFTAPAVEAPEAGIQTPENIEKKKVPSTAVRALAEAPHKAAARVARPVLAKVTTVHRLDRDQTVAKLQKDARPLPRLTADVDEEDGSLRLADLFDDVEDNL